MKQFFLNIAVPRISFLSAVVSSIFILSLTSSVYKSSSAIDVSSSGSDSFASSFTSSLISSSGSSDAFQIKLYLESHEASNILREKYEIENFFVKDDISFFSKFRDTWYQNFHEYLEGKLKISVDANSNTLLIETFAFSPKEAKLFNLSLVDITSDFLNKKARLAAINSRSGKICELYLANSGLIGLNINEIEFESKVLFDESNTLNKLLIDKADSFKDYCVNKLNSPSNSETRSKESLNIPSFELRAVNAEASKNIITEIYQDSIGIISEAEYVDIVAEPVMADKPESKMTILISLIVYAITFIALITIKIFIRLTDEFKL